MRVARMMRWCGAVVVVTAAGVFASVPAQAAPDLSASITGSMSDGAGYTMPYRLFRPPGYTTPPATKKFPLVVFLHGAGERGTNNTSQVNSHIDGLVSATQSAQYASYLLAPQVASDKRWVERDWALGSFRNAQAPPQSSSITLTLQMIDSVIASNPNIDTSRIYVTGLSMGGFGTWDLISRRPTFFAAAAPMSGGGNMDTAGLIKNIPIWNFHGDQDGTIPVTASRDMITAVQAAGGTPKYTELAGQGHVIWAPIYTDTTTSGQFYPWMFAQSTPEPGAIGMGVVGVVWWMGRRARR